MISDSDSRADDDELINILGAVALTITELLHGPRGLATLAPTTGPPNGQCRPVPGALDARYAHARASQLSGIVAGCHGAPGAAYAGGGLHDHATGAR